MSRCFGAGLAATGRLAFPATVLETMVNPIITSHVAMSLSFKVRWCGTSGYHTGEE